LPELPEVETIRRGLEKTLLGRRVMTVDVREPFVVSGPAAKLSSKMTGQTLRAVARHGKKLYLDFSSFRVSIHLRMTGRLLLVPKNTPPDKFTHIVTRFETGPDELHFCDVRKFGRWKMEKAASDQEALAPDAWLAPKAQVVAALRQKKGMIKHALLSQNVISGLGNIYVDESLHRAKIHPKKKLERINSLKISAFYDGMKAILDKSIAIGGTSFRDYVDTAGTRGGYKEWLMVYGKAGTKCACGGVIRRIVVAGRGTHYCPKCQR
jgi:formamidopyrimidine-DNA glycosylase